MQIGTHKYKKRWLIPSLIILGVVALFVLPFMSWLVGQETFHATGDAEFCVSCHTMEPMEKAYIADVHGGNNDHGVQATCTQCHLPHDNSFNYFVAKAQTGLHDMYVEQFGDLENIDWQAKRAHREDYVYDSGCLTCHNNLQKATMASNDALIAHKAYFLGTTKEQCVSCHENVGHTNLSDYLSSN
jgi:cytochrome c-type protein NapC